MLVSGLLVWLGLRWWPSEEKVIRNVMEHLVETASIKPSESNFARLAYPDRIASFFTTNAVIQLEGLGGDFPTVSSRTDLLAAAAAARSQLQQAEFKLVDLNVTFPPEERVANVYAVIVGSINLETNQIAHGFRLNLKKVSGRWLIDQMKTVERVQ